MDISMDVSTTTSWIIIQFYTTDLVEQSVGTMSISDSLTNLTIGQIFSL